MTNPREGWAGDCVPSWTETKQRLTEKKVIPGRKKGRKNQNPRFCRDTAAQTNNRDNRRHWDEVMCDKVAFPWVPLTCGGQASSHRALALAHDWRGAEIPSGGHLSFDVSLLTDCPVFFVGRRTWCTGLQFISHRLVAKGKGNAKEPAFLVGQRKKARGRLDQSPIVPVTL